MVSPFTALTTRTRALTITVDLGDSKPRQAACRGSEGPVGTQHGPSGARCSRGSETFDTDFRPPARIASSRALNTRFFDRRARFEPGVCNTCLALPCFTRFAQDQFEQGLLSCADSMGTGRVMSRVRHKRGLEAPAFHGLTLFVFSEPSVSRPGLTSGPLRTVNRRNAFYYLCELSEFESGHLTEDFHAWRTRAYVPAPLRRSNANADDLWQASSQRPILQSRRRCPLRLIKVTPHFWRLATTIRKPQYLNQLPSVASTVTAALRCRVRTLVSTRDFLRRNVRVRPARSSHSEPIPEHVRVCCASAPGQTRSGYKYEGYAPWQHKRRGLLSM
jgi:hypothetical protein